MPGALTHRLRAWRDDTRRAIVARLFDRPRPRVERLEGLQRVLFIRWDAKWGDSVVFSFVPRELQRHGVAVEVITTADMAPLFSGQYGVDAVHVAKKRAGYGEIRRLARQIGEVDLVVFFSQLANHRALYLLSQLQARHIASLDDSVGLVDLKLGELTRGQHFADKYLALLERCGIPGADMRYIVPRDEHSEARVEGFVQGRRPYVCFNAYSKGRARSFNRETSQRLIELLQQALPGHAVCVLSAPGRQKEVEALCERLGERVFSLPDTQTIYDNIALIARADALVSGNTATVHMADGLDVPSFEIFPHDRTSYEDWHSRHPRSTSLLAEPSDPLDVNCLDWTRVEEALGEFAASLNQPKA
jgi:ADP-heptose:LPS heptosyltransferase